MDDSVTVESVRCEHCGHTWVSSHPDGALTVPCPACEGEVFTLSDPDTIAELERVPQKRR
jgi:phage FluMu protein Com